MDPLTAPKPVYIRSMSALAHCSATYMLLKSAITSGCQLAVRLWWDLCIPTSRSIHSEVCWLFVRCKRGHGTRGEVAASPNPITIIDWAICNVALIICRALTVGEIIVKCVHKVTRGTKSALRVIRIVGLQKRISIPSLPLWSSEGGIGIDAAFWDNRLVAFK